jgi:hypothetical protein
MTGGGKRQSRKKHTAVTEHVQSIPELRRAFDHIEKVGMGLCHKPMKDAVAAFQQEWKKTFFKELNSKSAEAYLEHLKKIGKKGRKTRKLRGGMAPIDYTTRPGLYVDSAQVPPDSYAKTTPYIQSGFWNPERSTTLDPIYGQTTFPEATPRGMGTNAYPAAFGVMKGGSKKKTRKLRGGMSALSQAFMRPIPPNAGIPSVFKDGQDAFFGQKLGASPDPSDPSFTYQMSPALSKGPIDISVTPIPVNMNDVLPQ